MGEVTTFRLSSAAWILGGVVGGIIGTLTYKPSMPIGKLGKFGKISATALGALGGACIVGGVGDAMIENHDRWLYRSVGALYGAPRRPRWLRLRSR